MGDAFSITWGVFTGWKIYCMRCLHTKLAVYKEMLGLEMKRLRDYLLWKWDYFRFIFYSSLNKDLFPLFVLCIGIHVCILDQKYPILIFPILPISWLINQLWNMRSKAQMYWWELNILASHNDAISYRATGRRTGLWEQNGVVR